MHRFFIEPRTLGYQAETYNRWDDPRWCALVDEFRWSIRLREWKEIDRRLRLFVKVEEWDGSDVLLIANPPTDDILVDAYIKAGFLEGQAIMVFAQHNIPWQRLKPFRASPGGCTHHKSGAAAEGESGGPPSPARATEERHSGPTSLVNGTARSGDPDTVAGGCLMRPKQYEAGLSAKEPSSLCPTLTVRSSNRGQRGVAVKNPLGRKEQRRNLKG